MFVTSAGMSERPPIPWKKPTSQFVFKSPHIIGLSSDMVVVYRYKLPLT